MKKPMLLAFEQVVAEVSIEPKRLTAWVEQRWLLPVRQDDGRILFDEADVARAQLIAELTGELGVGEEAIPVVLRLLDQVYELRRNIAEIHDALDSLPEEMRAEIRAVLARKRT